MFRRTDSSFAPAPEGRRTAVADLRRLLSARFPERARGGGGRAPTGVPGIDETTGGGLAFGRLTELVCAAPSGGGQLVLARLLAATRAAGQRVALIDASDSFSPGCVPADALRHLVWIRVRGAAPALAAADVLVRDGNYAAVVLDLCGCPARELKRMPASAWHRLHRAAADGGAVLVKSPCPLVPAVPWRFSLQAPLGLGSRRKARCDLAGELSVVLERGHAAEAAELAG